MRFSILSLSAVALTAAAPAMAQDAQPATGQDMPAAPTPGRDPSSAIVADTTETAPAIKVTGSATLISDYRFRGLTQSDSGPAAQGTISVNSKLGFYVGTFLSTIDGSGKPPLLAG